MSSELFDSRLKGEAAVGVNSVQDMGKDMAELKARHGAILKMGLASALVKAALG